MPITKNTEGLLWLNFLLSQTKWEFQEAKKYTHNTWLEIKVKDFVYLISELTNNETSK